MEPELTGSALSSARAEILILLEFSNFHYNLLLTF